MAMERENSCHLYRLDSDEEPISSVQSGIRSFLIETFGNEEDVDGLWEVLKNGGRAIYASDSNGACCAFVAGCEVELDGGGKKFPSDGSFFYIFDLASTAEDPFLVWKLMRRLLEDVRADYLLCHVRHSNSTYRSNFYPRLGWEEVEVGKASYFFIRFRDLKRKFVL